MSDFFEISDMSDKVVVVSIVHGVPITEESFERYEVKYKKVYDEHEKFVWVFDTQNMADVPEWFWVRQFTLTTSQRIKKQQVIGVCVVISSDTLATLITALLKLYDTDRPTFISSNGSDAATWISNIVA